MTSARRWGVLAAAVAILVVVTGVIFLVARDNGPGQQDSTGTTAAPAAPTRTAPTAPTATTEPETTVTASPGTAANDLATFFSAAQQADERLKTAATAINGDVTGDELRVDEATADAVDAARTAVTEAADVIPAGLEPDLLRSVLLVQSDLTSRSAAMNPALSVGTRPMSEVEPCLRNGGVAAARYDADLDALRSLADASPPVIVAAPDSRAAQEIAVRLREIYLLNNGCESCGGFVATDLSQVSFYDAPVVDPGTGLRWDGLIGDVSFRADREDGNGWRVELNAC